MSYCDMIDVYKWNGAVKLSLYPIRIWTLHKRSMQTSEIECRRPLSWDEFQILFPCAVSSSLLNQTLEGQFGTMKMYSNCLLISTCWNEIQEMLWFWRSSCRFHRFQFNRYMNSTRACKDLVINELIWSPVITVLSHIFCRICNILQIVYMCEYLK